MTERKALTYRGVRGHALVDSEDVTDEIREIITGLWQAELYLDAEDDMTENARKRIEAERERLESVLNGDDS